MGEQTGVSQLGSRPVCGEPLQALAKGTADVIDLMAPLSATTPTLELPPPFVNLIDFSLDSQSEYNAAGPFWKHADIHTGEHIGIHVDAPIHWISGRDGKDVSQILTRSQIAPQRLMGPAVLMDFSAQASQDPDFLIEPADIKAWEQANGASPGNCRVLVRTGWDARSADRKLFLNKDASSSHTSGFSADCARWLAKRSEVSGVGVEVAKRPH